MNKSFAIPILFFIALIIAVYFVLPAFSDFNSLKKELEIREKEALTIENYYRKIHNNFDKLKEHQETLEKIDSALPGEFFSPSLFDYLQKTSAENGMFLKNVSLATPAVKKAKEKEKSTERIQEEYVSIELIGSYDSFQNFLKSVEKSSRLIEVENIRIKTEEEELATFSLLLKVYSY